MTAQFDLCFSSPAAVMMAARPNQTIAQAEFVPEFQNVVMKPTRIFLWQRNRSRVFPLAAGLLAALLTPSQAHASNFKGEALDNLANLLAWVVLVIAPTVGIAAFWIVHILPEKIAEKKHHPQAKAIQCLCLLSLVFGGLLWPIAWLWAFTKPVLYKAAYGTDKVVHGQADQVH